MLWVLIPVVWLAVVFFGLTVCRLGALSDRSYAVEMAEWMAVRELADHELGSAERAAEQLPFKAYRATG